MDYYSDDEDYDFDSIQSITLFDNEPTAPGAQLKYDFEGTDFHYEEDNDSQPDGIVDEDIGDGALSLKCDITKVVNGTLSKDGTPATLIVFQFAFLPHGNNHRFKTVQIIITFSSGRVHSISPDNEWTTLPSEKVQERTHTVSPSLEAAFGPAKATAAYTWQQTETQTLRGYAKVTGAIRSLGHSRGMRLGMKHKQKNTVMWGLYEDPQARPRTGIPSLLQSAVLVEREATDTKPFGERFSASIRIHGKVDRAAEAKDKMAEVEKWMSGRTRKGKDIWFPPHPRTNKGAAMHPDSLEDEDLDAYRHLIAIRSWESGPALGAKEGGGGLGPPPDGGGGTVNPPDPTVSSPATTNAPATPASRSAAVATRATTESPAKRNVPTSAGKTNDPIPIAANPMTAIGTRNVSLEPAGSKSLPVATAIPDKVTPPSHSPAPVPEAVEGSGKITKRTNTVTRMDPLAPLTDDDDSGNVWHGQKRKQRQQKTPENVTVRTNEALLDSGEDNDEDIILPGLYEQLRLVRAETKWAIRVVQLLAEERRLLRRIATLEE